MTRATTRAQVGNKATHVSKGNVFDDIGFSPSQALALKLKAEVLGAILDEIDAKQYSAKVLVERLDEYEPQVSNLMGGKISKMSLEKLLSYCDRLGIGVSIALRPGAPSKSDQIAENMKGVCFSERRKGTSGKYLIPMRPNARTRGASSFSIAAKSR